MKILFNYTIFQQKKKEAVSNAKFETASLGLTRGIGRFEEEASFHPEGVFIYVKRKETAVEKDH